MGVGLLLPSTLCLRPGPLISSFVSRLPVLPTFSSHVCLIALLCPSRPTPSFTQAPVCFNLGSAGFLLACAHQCALGACVSA